MKAQFLSEMILIILTGIGFNNLRPTEKYLEDCLEMAYLDEAEAAEEERFWWGHTRPKTRET